MIQKSVPIYISLLIAAVVAGGCLRSIGTARLGLDDVQVVERGFTIDGLYQFDLVPKIRNTGVLRAEGKLAMRCRVEESEEKDKQTDPFFLNLDTGQSKNGRPVTFTSKTADPGTRINYKCHLIPNDAATQRMLSADSFNADFEVTGS